MFHSINTSTTEFYKTNLVVFFRRPGPIHEAALKQNSLFNNCLQYVTAEMSRIQTFFHVIRYMYILCSLAGNHILVSIILLCIATFFCWSSSMKMGPAYSCAFSRTLCTFFINLIPCFYGISACFRNICVVFNKLFKNNTSIW